MVRNTIGGKAYKKSKSGNVRRRSKNPDVPVDTTTGIDHYANVVKRLGNNRLLVKLDNGDEVQAVIPGRFMKKIWFNPGDYIHVRCEGEGFYDIIQKILNPLEQNNAQISLSKRETGEEDFFRPDISEESDDDEFVNNNDGDDAVDELGNPIKSDPTTVIKKQTVSADKLVRKQKEKERDIQRRAEANLDYSDRVISVVTNSKNSNDNTYSTNSTDSTDSTDSSDDN